MSHLEAFVTATAFDTEREVFNYQPIMGATQTEQDTEILGLGYLYPRFCPVSDLVGENWAVVDLENYVIVHRVTFLRDQSTNCWYRLNQYSGHHTVVSFSPKLGTVIEYSENCFFKQLLWRIKFVHSR